MPGFLGTRALGRFFEGEDPAVELFDQGLVHLRDLLDLLAVGGDDPAAGIEDPRMPDLRRAELDRAREIRKFSDVLELRVVIGPERHADHAEPTGSPTRDRWMVHARR